MSDVTPIHNPEQRKISKVIGRNLRNRRIEVGMSQEKLGEKLGLTFQQIQKYENATNRISCPVAVLLAKALSCEITVFFEGIQIKTGKHDVPVRLDRQSYRFAAAIQDLSTSEQTAFVRMAEMFSGHQAHA